MTKRTGSPFRKKADKQGTKPTFSYNPAPEVFEHLQDTKKNQGASFKWQLDNAMFRVMEEGK